MPLEVSVGFARVEELTAVLMNLLFFWYLKLFRVLICAEMGTVYFSETSVSPPVYTVELRSRFGIFFDGTVGR